MVFFFPAEPGSPPLWRKMFDYRIVLYPDSNLPRDEKITPSVMSQRGTDCSPRLMTTTPVKDSFYLLRPYLSLLMVQHSIAVLAVGYIRVFFRHLYVKQIYRLNRGLNMQLSGDLLCSWIMNNVRLPLTGGLKRKM